MQATVRSKGPCALNRGLLQQPHWIAGTREFQSGEWLEPRGISCLSSVIILLRVVFRETVLRVTR